MAKLESPYLIRKEIPLADLQRVAQSKVYVRQSSVVLFDDEGEDSGERHTGPFLFREVVGFAGEPLGFERVLDQKVVRRPGLKHNDKFTTTGTDSDAFTPIGEAWQKGILNIEGPIIVCAGIAEGYRLHEATGIPVACCVGEQKIPKLAKMIKSVVRNPDDVFIAVDNDKAGYVAALRSGLPYIMPTEEKDFSDVYQNAGGVVAVRAEARNIRQPLSPEEREAELDRLMNRQASTNTRTPDYLALYDDRYYREELEKEALLEQHTAGQSQDASAPEDSTQLLLAKTDFTELGFSGMLQVNHNDCNRIKGYQHFQRMAELLDVGVYEEDGVDQWILSSAESMTLLVAMVNEGLGDVLGEMSSEYSQLKAHIYEGITDGLLDHSDVPGGSPAFVTLSESAKGIELRLQSEFDPEIRKACLAAKGYFDKSLQCWRFQVRDANELAEKIKTLADNPLRRMVFLMPDEDPEWLIGTPTRIETLQTKFLDAAGMATPAMPSMAETLPRIARVQSTEPSPVPPESAPAPAEIPSPDVSRAATPVPRAAPSTPIEAYDAGEDEPLDAASAFADEEESPAPEPEKPVNTLATVRLIKYEGRPALMLRSPYDRGLVNICRKVKRQLESAFPDQPRAQFNHNESGAWHFPISNRKALALALDAFCREDCDEISVVTPEGKILATQAQRDRLMAAMQLSAEGPAQEARGKPSGVPESPPDKPDGSPIRSSRPTAKPEDVSPHPQPQSRTPSQPVPEPVPDIDPQEEIYGNVRLEVKGTRLELVLKSEFDERVVAACKRIKNHLDAAHPDQPKATFNRDKDKAWRFSVTDEKALDDAISALCFEDTPPLLMKTQYGASLLTLDNHAQLLQWAGAEAASAVTNNAHARTAKPRPSASRQWARDRAQDKEARNEGARSSYAEARRKKWTQRHAQTDFSARMTFHQGTRNDYFMLRMNRHDPELFDICEKAQGEFKRRDRAWHFPIFSTSELKRTIETICGCDLKGVEVIVEEAGDKPVVFKAEPGNCSKLVRHFNHLRMQSRPAQFDELRPEREEIGHHSEYADPGM